MELLKKEYICPFCFERSNLYNVKFRCSSSPSNCPLEEDKVLSNFLELPSYKLMSKVIEIRKPKNNTEMLKSLRMPRDTICSYCNKKTTNRICCKCHSDLPHTIGDFPDLTLAVIGAKEAGKSHYIAVLIDYIMNKISESFNCSLQPLNDETTIRYREIFYNPVFRNKEAIKGTVSARADRSVKTPLIYSLSFMGKKGIKGLFGKEEIINSVTLVFFDTAGEDLDSEDIMKTENKYIFNAAGIILLLDPLQLLDVRNQLAATVRLPKENTETSEIVSRTARLIRKARGIKQDKLIDIPIAVSFSKIDSLKSLVDPASCLNYPSKHKDSGAFDLDDFNDVNSNMQALVKEWSGAGIIQDLKHSFKNSAFFGFTSLGCTPDEKNKIPFLRPQRIEDPFLWLLWKNNVIQGKKRK